MHDFTPRYMDLMAEMAKNYHFYLIAGSHPNLRDGALYNTAFMFSPKGEVFAQDKIHRTRWEREKWDTAAGDRLHLFQTDYGAIGILICYDIEFPELARQVCEAGADILFAPHRPTTARVSGACATAPTRAPSRTRSMSR